jgi:DNA-binding XRE family transcriptional regulator
MKNVVAKDINKFIELRIKKGYSVAELARTSNVCRCSLHKFEKCGSITPKAASSIVATLNVNFDDLFVIE